MQQTEQYGLNQWELTDRVLMSDFNADNLKLDAALAGKLGKPELMRQWVSQNKLIGGASRAFRVDWNEWEYVCVFFDYPKTDLSTADKIKYALGDKEGTPQGPELGDLSYGPACIILFPHHDETRPTQGLLLGSQMIPFKFDIPFSRIDGYDIFPANSNQSIFDPNVYGFGGK